MAFNGVYPKTETIHEFDLPLSPIPTRELSQMHLKAVSDYLLYRNSMYTGKSHTSFEFNELARLHYLAAEYHYALNMRLHMFEKVESFSAFIRGIDKF